MNNADPISFANYLGVDYKKTGGLVRIICPFHNDSDPSMVLYEDHAYCYACGEGASLPWLAMKIKNIPYPQALKDLGMDTLPVSEISHAQKAPSFQPLTFCESPKKATADAFKMKHEKCRTIEDIMENGPDNDESDDLIRWLDKKKLLYTAIELDWRWHDGTVFKHWGKGIVIPYKVGDKIVYERFRGWIPQEHKFDKPISPYNLSTQPYLATYRPNDTVFIVEGESDSASVYAHGCSAIGVPGAVAKKVINTAVAFISDRPYIKTVVCCGDNDSSGQKMNSLVHQAVLEMCPNKAIVTYTIESKGEKSDLNDDHASSLFKPPIEYSANYGDNYSRQPWADKDFAEICDKFEDEYEPCAENTTDSVLKGAVIYSKKGKTLNLDSDKWKKIGKQEQTEPDYLVVEKVDKHPSKYGGNFWYVFFKDYKTGKTYRSCVDEKCRNFSNWRVVLDNANDDSKIVKLRMDTIRFKGNMVDADSLPIVVISEKSS